MTSEELLNCLVDRPCSACKFHKENGCSKWDCVFDTKPQGITDEQAIDHLRESGWMQAHDKALSEPYLCEDAISKNNVITSICQYGTAYERKGKYVLSVCDMKQDLVDLIQSLPSVQPKPKTGKWIVHRNDLSTLYRWECDKCHRLSKTDFNYCPNCGCQMEGDKK